MRLLMILVGFGIQMLVLQEAAGWCWIRLLFDYICQPIYICI